MVFPGGWSEFDIGGESEDFRGEWRGGKGGCKFEFVVAVFLLYFFYMLFGRLLDSHNETTDSQLLELER